MGIAGFESRHAGWVVSALLVTATLAAGCSSDSPADTNEPPLTSTATTTPPSPADEPGDAGADESTTPSSGSPTPVVVRPAENTGEDLGENWIGHAAMTSTAVELTWSEVPGGEVIYRVWRVPTEGGFDPATVRLEVSEAIYDGPDTDHVDTSVDPDTFYTYLLVAEADGASLPLRWTQTLTSDDTMAPTPVTDLVAEQTTEGVVLSWGQAVEETEFGAYAVSVRNPDGSATYVGGGNEVDQTSFLDTRPPVGTEVSYVVEAVDFHDNRSQPVEVSLTVE